MAALPSIAAMNKAAIATGSVSNAEVAGIVTKISEQFERAQIANVADMVQFEGYKPQITMRICNEFIGTDSNRKNQLLMLIVFGMVRGFGGGKSWATMLARTPAAHRQTLTAAKNAFDVQIGRPQDAQTITIPRLMQAFPFYTYKIYCALVESGRLTPIAYEGALPKRLQWIGSPAAMNAAVWTAHRNDYLAFTNACALVWRKPQNQADAEKFADLAYSSECWPLANRPTEAEINSPLEVVQV